MHARVSTLRLYANRISAFCAAVIALCALLYGVFLLLAVTHTASRARAQAGIERSTAELASLEQRYLALQQQITPARAADFGLVKPASSATVFADANAPALTLVPPPR